MFKRWLKKLFFCSNVSIKDDDEDGAREAAFETEEIGRHASYNDNGATEAKEEFKHDEGGFCKHTTHTHTPLFYL